MKTLMTHKSILYSLFIAVVLGIFPLASVAQTKTDKSLVFESQAEGSGKIVIAGTSSLHDWEVVGEIITGTLKIATSSETPDVIAVSLPVEAQVKVPVASLESGKGIMNKKMFKALDSKNHKDVIFVLDSLEIDESALKDESGPKSKTSAQTLNVKAKGKLTIAGETRWIQFPAVIAWDAAKKHLAVSGEVELRMTDFGFNPPTALLGTLKTGDVVTVSFNWTPALK